MNDWVRISFYSGPQKLLSRVSMEIGSLERRKQCSFLANEAKWWRHWCTYVFSPRRPSKYASELLYLLKTLTEYLSDRIFSLTKTSYHCGFFKNCISLIRKLTQNSSNKCRFVVSVYEYKWGAILYTNIETSEVVMMFYELFSVRLNNTNNIWVQLWKQLAIHLTFFYRILS